MITIKHPLLLSLSLSLSYLEFAIREDDIKRLRLCSRWQGHCYHEVREGLGPPVSGTDTSITRC